MMYSETKDAIKQSFWIGKMLFPLGVARFNKLVEITNTIGPPTDAEILSIMKENNVLKPQAIALWFKSKYQKVAEINGFTKAQGIAMLRYAAFLKEIEDES